jgi:serine/threonine protein kinase
MKFICSYGNLTEEGSYWCKNCTHNCPPAKLSVIFEHGEMIHDLQIIELIRLFPTSALYRAKRGKKSVMVKVAHNGFEQQLKNEARLLSDIEPHPALPILLSAQEERVYGKFTIREQIKYFLVFKDAEGEFLDAQLRQNPQPVPKEIAWLIISLGDVIAYLHVKGKKLLTSLNPNGIIVRTDKAGVPRPLLLDLGMLIDINAKPVQIFGVPVYSSPEQVGDEPCTVATDVYSLGAVMYEMLAGEPVFLSKLKSDDEIKAMILQYEPVSLRQRRPELISGIADVAHRALQKHPAQRQPDIRTFAKGLRVLFGEVPVVPRRGRIDRRIIAVFVFIVLVWLLWLVITLLAQS